MQRKQNQSGSAHAIIIGILTLALLAALGWIFYQNFIRKDNAKKQQDSHQEQGKKEEATDPLSRVQSFYKEYLTGIENSSGVSRVSQEDAVQKYTLSSAWPSNVDYDVATCSQNPLSYDKYNFDTPNIVDSTVTVKITGKYASSGDTSFTVELVKQTDASGTWMISKFNCPQMPSQ